MSMPLGFVEGTGQGLSCSGLCQRYQCHWGFVEGGMLSHTDIYTVVRVMFTVVLIIPAIGRQGRGYSAAQFRTYYYYYYYYY